MTGTAILMIWTIVGLGSHVSVTRSHDWRALGEFASAAHCQKAALQLGLGEKTFRCVLTGKATP